MQQIQRKIVLKHLIIIIIKLKYIIFAFKLIKICDYHHRTSDHFFNINNNKISCILINVQQNEI